jgi:hypothetical protein
LILRGSSVSYGVPETSSKTSKKMITLIYAKFQLVVAPESQERQTYSVEFLKKSKISQRLGGRRANSPFFRTALATSLAPCLSNFCCETSHHILCTVTDKTIDSNSSALEIPTCMLIDEFPIATSTRSSIGVELLKEDMWRNE